MNNPVEILNNLLNSLLISVQINFNENIGWMDEDIKRQIGNNDLIKGQIIGELTPSITNYDANDPKRPNSFMALQLNPSPEYKCPQNSLEFIKDRWPNNGLDDGMKIYFQSIVCQMRLLIILGIDPETPVKDKHSKDGTGLHYSDTSVNFTAGLSEMLNHDVEKLYDEGQLFTVLKNLMCPLGLGLIVGNVCKLNERYYDADYYTEHFKQNNYDPTSRERLNVNAIASGKNNGYTKEYFDKVKQICEKHELYGKSENSHNSFQEEKYPHADNNFDGGKNLVQRYNPQYRSKRHYEAKKQLINEFQTRGITIALLIVPPGVKGSATQYALSELKDDQYSENVYFLVKKGVVA